MKGGTMPSAQRTIRRLVYCVSGFICGILVIHICLDTLSDRPVAAQYDLDSDAMQARDNPILEFRGKIFHLSDEVPGEPLKHVIHAVFEANEKKMVKMEKSKAGIISANDEDFLSWQQLQTRRIQAMEKYCEGHQLRKPLQQLEVKSRHRLFKTLLVDDRHDVLYCPVGKVACTSWKTALAMLQGHYTGLRPGEHIHDIPVLLRNDIRPLHSFSRDEALARLKTYASFMFVRHPFERLVSAYRNKFRTDTRDDYQKRYGSAIIRQYRDRASEAEIASGWNVSFAEFARWLVDHNVPDIHWARYDSICHMCTVRYDYVGTMDTFERDTRHMLRALFGVNNTDFFPHSNPSKDNSRHVLMEYFKDVPDTYIEQLKVKYQSDFEMFNFTWPPV